MNLQTKIPLKTQKHNQIDYNSEVLLLGSCFVENIGQKLDYFKFQTVLNPFGILFQPKAIENLISNAVQEKVYTETDIFFQNEQWHSFEAHSVLSNTSKAALLDELNAQIQFTREQIVAASHFVITLGTAWVYRDIESETVVANCHKVPQKKFSKELLSVANILKSLQASVQHIKSVNQSTDIIFTVSPIRHLKDGFIENTQSKAHLITAIHELLHEKSSHDNGKLHYFPSYEIMMDELRDYRFYADDMIHPSQTAIHYIWNAFKTVWISESASKTMEAIDEIQRGLQHKPFNSNSEAHQLFLKKLSEKKEKMETSFPHITF
ncbi:MULTISPECIES: GSCFA domain-containing protein [Bizionia]|uniref:GSCFA domain-containing protein n=1 Tax=Bizionia algoritergicola TaxID=291187 RepID=A0A5D0QUT0_9FLAO|nr:MULTISPECIES: GSCFA domain-containing protein [Bizionia]OBX22698.1 GSCFA domain-containing protein [Bizionia sp. APA-3]TYB72872.1 GSCFA domain-containing protein [Bizionia algoritergicola]